MNNFNKVFAGSKVLITGHTGFKGSWLSSWLKLLGANLIGVSDQVKTNPSHYEYILNIFNKDLTADIRNLNVLKEIIKENKPEFIFHLAAQPIVLDSYRDPYSTFTSNTLGTINLLEALRTYTEECNVVIITSDKSYENLELDRGYHEEDRIGGLDPYSASKGAAELAIKSYFASFFKVNHRVKLAVARAGNVVGGGDWSSGRIVPDAIKAWQDNKPLIIRNPYSTRPWQHVLEPLHGYLLLAKFLKLKKPINGEAFNFGPHADQTFNVADVTEILKKYLLGFSWEADFKNNSNIYESKLLALNITKANKDLDWSPTLSIEDTFRLTAEWYENFYESAKSEHIFNFTIDQIENYIQKL
ncbi:MAG: CDP-glucose 4,6-dehydratase [Rickettsiales bacterium TMED289]|nr:MAG: CDP-glucose 4,6-dehydratase [Rickettsiales bacterium TMED289]